MLLRCIVTRTSDWRKCNKAPKFSRRLEVSRGLGPGPGRLYQPHLSALMVTTDISCVTYWLFLWLIAKWNKSKVNFLTLNQIQCNNLTSCQWSIYKLNVSFSKHWQPWFNRETYFHSSLKQYNQPQSPQPLQHADTTYASQDGTPAHVPLPQQKPGICGRRIDMVYSPASLCGVMPVKSHLYLTT